MLTQNIKILAGLTVKELLKRRVLQVLFLLFAFFLASLPLWKHFSPETEATFLAEFGIGLVGFFLLMISVIIGSDMIPRDLEEGRTAFFYTHPVEKAAYLLGRLLGCWVFLAFAFAILIGLLKALFIIKGWHVYFWPASFIFIKYVILTTFLFCVSSVVERFSAVFLGLAFYFFASSLSTLSHLAAESGNLALRLWITIAGSLLPHFEIFDVTGKGAGPVYIAKAVLYGLWFTGLFVVLTFLTLRRKTQ